LVYAINNFNKLAGVLANIYFFGMLYFNEKMVGKWADRIDMRLGGCPRMAELAFLIKLSFYKSIS